MSHIASRPRNYRSETLLLQLQKVICYSSNGKIRGKCHCSPQIHDNRSVLKERHSRLASGCTEEINKPYAIDQYNKFMDGVDKQDQFISYYGFSRRTRKWWKKVFFHLLDTAVVNAYIMYTHSQHSSKKLTHVQFRIELAKQLLLQGNSLASPELLGTQSPLQPAARLTEQHLLKKVPSRPNGKQSQHDCAVCSFKKGRKRRNTVDQCTKCGLVAVLYHVLNSSTKRLTLSNIFLENR